MWLRRFRRAVRAGVGGRHAVDAIAEHLDYDRLMSVAHAQADAYARATPFPHVVIDDFVSGDVLGRVIAEIPAVDAGAFARWEGTGEDGVVVQKGKRHLSDDRGLGTTTRRLLGELRSAAFLEVLHVLTRTSPLVSDPYNLGGGLHINEPGAILRIHADFRRHPLILLDRRLNLLLYLNEEWQESFGGCLELWPADMSACARRIVPIANRCVIFTTGPTSYHGHPDPLACPPGRTRSSIALYYYTHAPVQVGPDDFKTDWRARPTD